MVYGLSGGTASMHSTSDETVKTLSAEPFDLESQSHSCSSAENQLI